MARTRAQSREEAGGPPAKRAPPPKKASIKKRTKTEDEQGPKSSEHTPKKHEEHSLNPEEPKASTSKRHRTSKSTTPELAGSTSSTSVNPAISKLLSTYETVPLSDLDFSEPLKPTSLTALAHIFNALLSSARISHSIAAKTLSCLVAAGYCDLSTLQKTTWEERTETLTEGGYTHYREKTATALGDIAVLVKEKYGGDAARLVLGDDSEAAAEGEKKRNAVSDRLKDIKGLGPLGIGLFMETAQAAWPSLAPFMGERNLKALRDMGVQESMEDIYKGLDKDARSMARLCAAVTKMRLEGKPGDFG